MDNPRYAEVTIFGEKYKLVSTYKDKERTFKVSKLVDDKMEGLSARFPDYSKTKIAILTSLNLADELFRAYSEYDKLKERIDRLIDIVDKSLPDNISNEL